MLDGVCKRILTPALVEGTWPGGEMWIGGYLTSQGWGWAASGEDMILENWKPGRPDGDGDCMELQSESDWDDSECRQKQHSICEVDLRL